MQTERATRFLETAGEVAWRQLFEQSPSGVVLLRADATVLDANPAALLLAGPSRAPIHDRPFAEAFSLHPDEAGRFAGYVRRVLAGERVLGLEMRAQRAEGESRWLAISVGPVAAGRSASSPEDTVLVQATLADVTERVRARAALAQREREYRALADNTAVGIWQITPQGQTLYANPAMLYMLEVESLEEVQEAPLESFYEEEFLPLVRKEHAKRPAGLSSTYEIVLVGRRGTRRQMTVTGAPVLDAEGKLTSLIGTFLDMTARRKAEEDRRRLEARRREAQRLESLGVLAGGVAHDFNNLLTGILGNLLLAQSRLPPGAPAQPLLDRIEGAARRAADLTAKMLAYSGRSRFQVRRVDVGAVVEDLRVELEAVARARVTLDVASSPGPLPVQGDAVQLRQVVEHLVHNAVEACEGYGGHVQVTTAVVDADAATLAQSVLGEAAVPGPYVALEVSDDGAGIAPDLHRRIFDPFYTTKSTGRGLGLAAVLGIIRAHQGMIRVESRPGQGTRIVVLLPRATGVEEDIPVDSRPTEAGGSHGTILVVDDEEVVLDVTRIVLEDAGYRVLTASGGREAQDLLRAHAEEVALVVLDLTMPDMDGEETFHALRAVRPDLRVVLCSGYSEHEAMARFAGEGLAGFLQKPFRPTELVAAVRDVLTRA